MPDYAFTLPFAVDPKAAYCLLAQRQLIQTRQGGKSVKGVIPEWAGQWALIGGPGTSGETQEETAVRTFQEQTGLNLKDSDVEANFLLGNRSTATLKTEDYQSFGVQCIFTTLAGLQLLETVIGDVVGTEQVSEGVIASASLLTMDAARGKIGPTAEPSGGWQKFLIQSYYGGKAPGQLNTEINTLTTQITERAAQDASFFTAALSSKDGGS